MVSVHVMAMRCAYHLANAEDIAWQDSAGRVARPSLVVPQSIISSRIHVMREIALAALALAALATLAAAALGLNRARTPDGAYRAAIIGALGICGLLASLALVLF